METKNKKKHEVECTKCNWSGMADDLKMEVKKVGNDTHFYINCPKCNDWQGIQDCE